MASRDGSPTEPETPQPAEYERGVYDETADGKSQPEPLALEVECPTCGAPRGSWCGGRGDLHPERK